MSSTRGDISSEIYPRRYILGEIYPTALPGAGTAYAKVGTVPAWIRRAANNVRNRVKVCFVIFIYVNKISSV